jgi:hypothetical protein
MTAARDEEHGRAGISLTVSGRIRTPLAEPPETPVRSPHTLDDSPLLDVEACAPECGAHPSAKAGRSEERGVERRVAEGRFRESEGAPRGGRR